MVISTTSFRHPPLSSPLPSRLQLLLFANACSSKTPALRQRVLLKTYDCSSPPALHNHLLFITTCSSSPHALRNHLLVATTVTTCSLPPAFLCHCLLYAKLYYLQNAYHVTGPMSHFKHLCTVLCLFFAWPSSVDSFCLPCSLNQQYSAQSSSRSSLNAHLESKKKD